MNSLSWLFYTADVLTNIQGFATFTIFICSFLLLSSMVYFSTEDALDKLKPFILRYLWPLPLAIIIALFLPSKDTVYAIAASEMGEGALKSPLATKATKALDKWLDTQLEEAN